MKLKTVLRKDDFQGRAFVDHIEGSEVDHDAAAAHALMQAIEIIMEEPETHEIIGLASELMRSWGFDTGEDA